MTAILKIEDVKVQIIEFALPEMSLSSARSRMERKQFQFEIDSAELLNLLSAEYSQWVAESKEDDEQCGAPQDELAEAGYPELSQVLENGQLLTLVVGYYLFATLISKFSEASKTTKYWWDEVTSCSYNSQKVLINGICYSKKST